MADFCRRIGLCCVFGLGLFNILAAVLNRYYNFSNPNSYVFLYWYVAESGVALWVGNLPLCWPVLRLALGSKGDSSNPSYPNPSYPENSTRRRTQGRSKPSVWAKLEDERVPEQGSQIELVDQNPYYVEAKASGDAYEERGNGRITVVTKVEVNTDRHESARKGPNGMSVEAEVSIAKSLAKMPASLHPLQVPRGITIGSAPTGPDELAKTTQD
ncbi:hypothetical protein NW766_009722 [Fusarium irregulare]|uniref:Uncharacterized protein n=1 Tax=Fusarium irregulare TaxID=2494466 RepID=A0A9W8PII2_9HYPO|nr:hypothetical protein NW766_009722 [Fusarium irregulare]